MVEPNAARTKDELVSELGRDELPDGWTGGEVYHTGGGIYVREFTNEDRELRVTYSLSENQPGVGLDKIQWDDNLDGWIPEATIVTNDAAETDEGKFAAAMAFMESPESYE